MRPKSVLTLTTALVLGVPVVAHAVPSGNLIQNPGFEVAPTYDASQNPSTPASWTTDLPADTDPGVNPNDLCYGAPGGFPDSNASLMIGGGSRFYFAGYVEKVSLLQDYTLPAPATDFAGKTLRIGGQFGGFSSQEDNSTFGVDFLDSGSAVLGTAQTTPVTAADRGDDIKFLARDAMATVPAGTTKLHFFVAATRTDGSANDGYVDNVYATFDGSAPTPVASSNDARCPIADPLPTTTPTPTTPPVTTPPKATPPIVKPPTTTTPVKKPTIADVVTGLPSTKSCVSRRSFRIRLRNPKGTTISSATVKVNGKSVATRKGTRVTAPVNLKGLPKGKYTVSIRTVLANGTVVTGTRKYHTCAKKRHG